MIINRRRGGGRIGGEYNLVSTDNGDGTQNIAAVTAGEMQAKDVEYTANGEYEVTPDSGKSGLTKVSVTVDVSGGSAPAKGFLPTSWTDDGYMLTGEWYGGGSIPAYAIGASNDSYLTTLNKYLRDIDFKNGSGITSIGNYAFGYCTSLALTSLPSGVTSIGSYAFTNCTSLALTSLPSGVTSIGSYAFYSCTSLALTSLPSGVTSIANRAFRYCPGLTSITFSGTPDSIGNSAFDNCVNLLDIYVPWAEGAVAGAPWGATNATIHYNTGA